MTSGTALVTACVLAACATVVDPRPEYDRAVTEIRATTGARHVQHPLDDTAREQVPLEALLQDGLTAHEAVEVALLQNPVLAAAFHEIGIGKGIRVQAGLLANPSLSAALRFPSGGGRALVEAGLFGSLADLWRRPSREAAAQAELERRILDVAQQAAQLAADVRAAHGEALALAQLVAVAEEDHALAARLQQLAAARLAARAATAIDEQLARLASLQAEAALADARLAADEARRRLLVLLGLSAAPPGLQLVDVAPADGAAWPSPARLQQLALERRLDVRAARARLVAAAAELALQQGLMVRVVDVGLAAEREDVWSVGPGVVLELPVFDGNEAQVAIAWEALAADEQRLAAVRLAAVHEVESAWARTQAGVTAWRLAARALVPQAEAALELASQAYQQGATGIAPVLEARRALLGARRELVQRRRDAEVAVVDLEQAVGAPREQILAPGQEIE